MNLEIEALLRDYDAPTQIAITTLIVREES